MAESALSTDIWYFADPDKGRPIALGSVYIGEPDLDPEILANRVDVVIIQEDGTRVTIAAAAQPLTTNAGGLVSYQGSPVVVKVDGTYSVKVLDSLDVQKIYAPFVNETADAATGNEAVLIPNGSFEDETQFSGLPDSWDVAESATGTIAIDSTTQVHGIKSLKFTSVDATGAGTATTTDKFNVLESGDIDIRFSYISSAVDTLNKVQIKYYDATDSAVSTLDILNEGAANPLVWTPYLLRATAPATAVQAELILTGVDGAGTTVIGTTNFDDVSATPLTENAVVRTEHVANAVNYIEAKDSATGDKVEINATGSDVNIDISVKGKGTGGTEIDKIVDSSGNEVVIFDEVADAVNEVTITNAKAVVVFTDVNTLAFVSPDQITDSGSGFGSFVVGDAVVITGATASNNNGTFEVATATAGQLDFVEQTITNETPSASSVVVTSKPLVKIDQSGTDDVGVNIEGVELHNGALTSTDLTATGEVTIPSESGASKHFISSATAIASATVDFDDLLDGTYKKYVVELINVTPATDATDFYIRVQTGGSTWQTGAVYNYGVTAGANFIKLFTVDTSNVTAEGGITASISISDPSNTSTWTRTSLGEAGNISSVGTLSNQALATEGAYAAATAVTGIRFYFSSGNVASGEFRLYGISA